MFICNRIKTGWNVGSCLSLIQKLFGGMSCNLGFVYWKFLKIGLCWKIGLLFIFSFSKICEKALQLIVANSVALGEFDLVLTIQVTAYWTQVRSDGFIFYPVWRMVEKTHFDYAEITPNCALNHLTRCCFWSFVKKPGTHLVQSFFISECSCKIFLIHSACIFTMPTISITFTLRSSKTTWCIFLSIFWSLCLIWTSRTWSIVGVCTTAFKFTK